MKCKVCKQREAILGNFCDQCFVIYWDEYKEKYKIR